MQSSVCLPHVLLFPAMLLWPFIISSHHILLNILLSPLFDTLSLSYHCSPEFHLHWEAAPIIEPIGFNLQKKLWQTINILSFRSEHFQCNFQLLFLLLFLSATANYPFVCIHTTLNKTIEIYFTGKF